MTKFVRDFSPLIYVFIAFFALFAIAIKIEEKFFPTKPPTFKV